jgi:hypothetical protein
MGMWEYVIPVADDYPYFYATTPNDSRCAPIPVKTIIKAQIATMLAEQAGFAKKGVADLMDNLVKAPCKGAKNGFTAPCHILRQRFIAPNFL